MRRGLACLTHGVLQKWTLDLFIFALFVVFLSSSLGCVSLCLFFSFVMSKMAECSTTVIDPHCGSGW